MLILYPATILILIIIHIFNNLQIDPLGFSNKDISTMMTVLSLPFQVLLLVLFGEDLYIIVEVDEHTSLIHV